MPRNPPAADDKFLDGWSTVHDASSLLLSQNYRYRGFLSCLCLVLSTAATASKPPTYVGHWVLNQEETELLRTDLDDKTITIPTAGRTQISVMGIPLPGSGSRSASGHSPLTAKQPEVLRCKNMSIAVAGQTINLLYPDLDPSEQNETPTGRTLSRTRQ
ncbi:MAG: hypothetical protein CM15mP68_6930 [Pseudomonadota bacterium]|nr:MAG: hypothetical protein CM15mP68_6930 [Pseudomonadota bacterium]